VPDKAKFAKLAEVGYVIHPCCALCVAGDFKPSTFWGHCSREGHKYQHGKHSGWKKLGVFRLGCCTDGFKEDPAKLAMLESYGPLLKKDDGPETNSP